MPLYVADMYSMRAVRSIVRARARGWKRLARASMLTSTHVDEADSHRRGDKGRDRMHQDASGKRGAGY
jgi:hypothetical protein